MDKKKMNKLQEKGWKFGSASDFLHLSDEEALYVDLKVSLAQFLQQKRQSKNMTQEQFASLINSSQSRVAKMEKNDPTVSLDLMVRSLFALGTSKTELARAINIRSRRPVFKSRAPAPWHTTRVRSRKGYKATSRQILAK
jgi:transcriptional regulator with XRE-family HTH domain